MIRGDDAAVAGGARATSSTRRSARRGPATCSSSTSSTSTRPATRPTWTPSTSRAWSSRRRSPTCSRTREREFYETIDDRRRPPAALAEVRHEAPATSSPFRRRSSRPGTCCSTSSASRRACPARALERWRRRRLHRPDDDQDRPGHQPLPGDGPHRGGRRRRPPCGHAGAGARRARRRAPRPRRSRPSCGRSPTARACAVETDLRITGPAAQFGRGVMQDVSAKLMASSPTAWRRRWARRPLGTNEATPADLATGRTATHGRDVRHHGLGGGGCRP